MKRLIYVIPTMVILMLAIGCSSNTGEPISPSTSTAILDIPVSVVDGESANRALVGEWALNFDGADLIVTERIDRDTTAHMNVKPWISPVFTVIHIDTTTGIVTADAKITNPTALSGYDVRLIAYTDSYGARIKNPDDWTTLHDIAGGSTINPFRAYVKGSEPRLFGPFQNHTERIQFWFPPNNPPLNMAIDVSLGGSCEEPYSIENYRQDVLYNMPGSEANIKVRVLDHQANVNAVNLWCPAISGLVMKPFTPVGGNEWELWLMNQNLIAKGEYSAAIIATSTNSGTLALYDMVQIVVSDESGVPANPRIVGWWDMFYTCRDVVFGTTYAYVADASEGLKVVDYSNPKYPDIIGWADTSDAYAVDVQGNYAYIADYGAGLRIIDVSNPKKPAIVSTFDSTWNIMDVDVSGNYVYMAANGWGLEIVDISNPASPVKTDDVYTSANAQGVAYANNYAYIASGAEGIFRINVSDPYNPVKECFLDLDSTTSVTTSGNYAFVSDGYQGLKSVWIGSCPMSVASTIDTDGYAEEVETFGNRICVADGSGGLDLVDCTDPTALISLGQLSLSYCEGVGMTGSRAFVAMGSNGVVLTDISGGGAPVKIGSLGTGYYAHYVEVQGDNLYLTNQNDSFMSFDISDPTDPDLLGFLSPIYYPYDITSRPGLAFCARYSYGLNIFDLSNPANPIQYPGGSVATSYYAQSIAVQGNYAYVASGGDGLFLVNIANLGAPYVDSVEDTVNAVGVSIWGNYAYVADMGDGLKVIDISDPTDPDTVGSIDTYEAREVIAKYNYAYIADGWEGLKIIDVSNPAAPKLSSSLFFNEYANDITILGDYAYIASRATGLVIVGIKDKTRPYVYRIVDTDGYANHVVISENYAFVADEHMGLKVIKLF